MSEELVPPSVYQAVATVTALQKGRTHAHEIEPVLPVDDAIVDATLPFMSREVAGLVGFQRLTGCRPGEACIVRRCDIDMSDDIWLYRPLHHKNEYRSKARTIAIGPKAQEHLKAFFTTNAEDYLFCPARAVADQLAERSKNRKTPRWKSHMKRNRLKKNSTLKRVPSERYDTQSYGRAIARACARAFPLPKSIRQAESETHKRWWLRLNESERQQVKAWRQANSWHPNQLRHTFGTHVRKHHGLEAAQMLLGHSSADVSQIYAERDQGLAVLVASKVG